MPVTTAQPLVSIVLPVHNGQRFLRESLASCQCQTYPHWELLAVDDSSTDQTAEILAAFAAAEPRARLIRNPRNLGLAASLNRGFAAARGSIFTWTSDDNRYLPNALECLVAALAAHPTVALVYATQEFVDERGARLAVYASEPPETLCYADTVNACFAYRREVADQLGGYDQEYRLVEDWEYWLRIARHHELLPVAECLYQYRQHGGTLTHQHGESRWLQVERLLAVYLPRLRRKWPQGCARGYLRLSHSRWQHGNRWRAWRWLVRACAGAEIRIALREWRILVPLCLGRRLYYALAARLPLLRIETV